MDFELTDEQIFLTMDIDHWFHSVTAPQLYQVSGGPGTGKSTVVRYCIEKLGLTNDEVLYVAFSGRAANQLAKHGLPAKTIHSAIYDYIEEYVYDDHGKKIRYASGKPKTQFRFVLKERLPKRIKLIVVDEGSMVGEKLAKDLISFGIPMIVLGDINQLPPVMDKQFFLKNPDYILTKIMRQKENDPIVILSQKVLHNEPLEYGLYGHSAVIRKSDLNLNLFKNVDVVTTVTNKLRHKINDMYREEIKHIKDLDMPHLREKVICVKNNWNKSINGLFLTNGTAGIISDIDKYSYDKFSINISMIPSFNTKKEFRDLTADYLVLNQINPDTLSTKDKLAYSFREKTFDKFEYGYAVTVFKMQGDEADSVLFMDEDVVSNKTMKRKLEYTAITRARKQIIIVK